jgi:hypothetical protein
MLPARRAHWPAPARGRPGWSSAACRRRFEIVGLQGRWRFPRSARALQARSFELAGAASSRPASQLLQLVASTRAAKTRLRAVRVRSRQAARAARAASASLCSKSVLRACITVLQRDQLLAVHIDRLIGDEQALAFVSLPRRPARPGCSSICACRSLKRSRACASFSVSTCRACARFCSPASCWRDSCRACWPSCRRCSTSPSLACACSSFFLALASITAASRRSRAAARAVRAHRYPERTGSRSAG